MDASTGMAKLVEQRRRAGARVDELEKEAGAARRRLEEAKEALVQAEAAGAPAAQRKKLEQEYADAKTQAEAPWAERVEGGRRAIRDAQRQIQIFAGENLTELVADLEEQGQVAAADVTEHAEALVAAYGRRERIASEISQLAALTGAVRPGDVSRSRAEQCVRAASAAARRRSRPTPTPLGRFKEY
jgi:hypothetical protein